MSSHAIDSHAANKCSICGHNRDEHDDLGCLHQSCRGICGRFQPATGPRREIVDTLVTRYGSAPVDWKHVVQEIEAVGFEIRDRAS